MPENSNNNEDKDRGGRPFGLTFEIIERAVQFTKAGNSPAKALQVAGVSHRTTFRWLKEAQAVYDDSDPDNPPNPATHPERFMFWQLWHSLKKAESDSEALLVGKVFRAAENHWMAAAWILERRFAERWRKPDADKRRVEGLTDEQLLAELESEGFVRKDTLPAARQTRGGA